MKHCLRWLGHLGCMDPGWMPKAAVWRIGEDKTKALLKTEMVRCGIFRSAGHGDQG